MIKISASALKDFVVCNATYKFRRMDGIGLPRTTPLVKGSVVHETIELVERGEVKEADAEEYLQTRLFEELGKGDIEWSSYFTIGKFLESSKADLNNYFENRKGVVIESEWEFEFPSYSTKGILFHLVGKVDQIVDMGKNICVVDLKTSRVPPTEFEIKGDYQFTFYTLAYLMEYGKMPHKVYNFHLGSGEYINYPRTNSDLNELDELIDAMVDTIDDIDGNWLETNKSKGWHCNRCPYRHICYGIN